MRAVQVVGPGQVAVVQKDRPRVAAPTDAIVMVTTAGLGPLDVGRFRQGRQGVTPGGEFCGNVIEVGADVREIDLDDLIFCTTLVAGDGCLRFGMEIDGGHAEYVLVPNADATLVKTNAASEERSLLAGGSLGLGATAADLAMTELPANGALAVVGCDPCGIGALAWLGQRGVQGVVAIEPHPARSTLAKRYRAKSFDSVDGVPPADVVIVGDIADGPGIEVVTAMCKRGGAVVFCRPGEVAEWGARFHASDVRVLEARWPDAGVALSVAQAVHTRRLDLTAAVSHVAPLDDAGEAYAAAADLAPGVQKVLLKP